MRPSARRGSPVAVRGPEQSTSSLGKARVEGVRTSAAGPAGRPRALPRSAPPYCADRTLPEFDPLWRTVEDADIRVLPMMRFNPSGDLKWLGPQLSPAARRPADRR
jgi:hypothetical protein